MKKSMLDMPDKHAKLPRNVAVLSIAAGFLFTGCIDFISGVEIRAYPLYFIPLSLAAWRFGTAGAMTATLAATGIWAVSNRAAGLHYSTDPIWLINIFAQALGFGTVAALLCWARNLLNREQALSRTDNLTGLANARAFYQSVALAASDCRRHHRPLTLAYIDLDNFKYVNDRHGHARGDALLREVAVILRKILRSTDSAARIGGDEFVICFPETSQLQAQPILDRLRAAFALALLTDGCAVSASIGALSWAVPPANVDAMVAAADKVMYEVKKSGKNRVEIIAMPPG